MARSTTILTDNITKPSCRSNNDDNRDVLAYDKDSTIATSAQYLVKDAISLEWERNTNLLFKM